MSSPVGSPLEPALHATYQRPLTQWWIAGGVSMFTLVFLAYFAQALTGGGQLLSRVFLAFGSGVLTLSSGWLAVRVARAAVVIEPAQVVFRNYLRTRRVPWGEIRNFDTPGGYGLGNSGLRAVLRDGSSISSSVFTSGPLTKSGFADGVLENLNVALRARSDPVAGS